MKLSLFFAASLFSCNVFAHPLDLPFKLSEDELHTLERRAGGRLNTVGAGGNVQPRLEVRQMETTQPNQFTLFVLAMKAFQSRPQNQISSYYQISAIHGVPRQDFNGVGECSSCKNPKYQTNGYCTHDSVLFPAWHRAYMALFEQEFVSIAKSIANTFPSSSKAQMVAAANVIRFPYWDWAANPPNGGPVVPASFTSPQITLNGPSGSQTMANPLYQFEFQDPSHMYYPVFTSWKQTVRWPNVFTPAGHTQENLVISTMNRVHPTLKSQVYRLLTGCKQYLYFSNDRAGAPSSCANSLEAIHNTVHTSTGGTSTKPGHMWALATAAFDPIFWVHHAQVDRIFALWQTLNPGSYGGNQVAQESTWTIAPGTTQGLNSPLTPFYRSGNTFWTTAAVKDWTVFHYTYPEFQQGGGSQASVAKAVNALYGPGSSGGRKRDEHHIGKRGIFDRLPGAQAPNGSAYEYLANIITPRYKPGGSYQIFTFLGQPQSEDPESWMKDPNMVAPMGVPSMPDMEDMNVPISGQIPLTDALNQKLQSGELPDLSEATVEPYLAKNFEWRIMGPQGFSLDPDTVPNFQVSVMTTTSSNPESDEFIPEYSEHVPMTGATHGKKGGRLNALQGLFGLDD